LNINVYTKQGGFIYMAKVITLRLSDGNGKLKCT